MIGNAAEATDAVAGTLEFLGRGMWRKAYANADRSVVYKVCHQPESDYMNEYEFGNSFTLNQRRDEIPEFVSIPEVSIYHVSNRKVVALPFIDGEPFNHYDAAHSEMMETLWAIFGELGIKDMGGDNIRFTADGVAHIVDLGYDW